jgi:hypothetical protein
MRKVIGIAIVASSLALSTAAFASSAGDGSDYGTQPGYNNAIANSNGCAGAGSFDAFGKGANLGIAESPGNGNPQHATFLGSWPGPGTDGQQTRSNNSNLCGNPQNN